MTSNTTYQFSDTSWRALNFFNLYRLLIALLFVALIWFIDLPEPLGVFNQLLFSISVHIYLFSTLVFHFLAKLRKPNYVVQVAIQVLFDITIISLLMYASAGLNSGFGMLLVIAVVGGSILTAGRVAFLYAAIAALAVLGQEIYVEFILYSYTPNYIHAGFLGITFFVTALLGHALARRVRETEALALQRAVDLESLSRLYEHIVQRLQSGILVLDDAFTVRLLNESARVMLGLSGNNYMKPIMAISPELALKLDEWLNKNGKQTVIIRSNKGELDVQASFTRLRPDTRFEVLIFIDDVAQLRQRAQHMKLASLGRMAASIAHEVRNPLGAISHASQLLSESDSVFEEDKRLIEIITNHSRRVNAIIENVQKISRREPATLENIELKPWLDDFILEFRNHHQLKKNAINYSVNPDNMLIRMDSSQLHQVLWNLGENAIRYSNNYPLVEINCRIGEETERPFIDIIDHGPGIPEDVEEHLFEPFFTKDSNGSGLGLYIAREMCEANQASLNLHANSDSGCCFRINLAHIERQHNLIQ